MAAQHKTGGDVDAYCNKCQLVLAHIIIAMKETRIVKVECKTCRSVHAYRREARGTAPKKAKGKSTSASRAAARAAAAGANAYEQAMAGQNPESATAYRGATAFKAGELLAHGKFGVGRVLRILADAKIEVIFSDTTRVLVHMR